MNTVALFLGYLVLTVGGIATAAGLVYAAVYWTTYWINESHVRAAQTIAGKGWLELLRKAADENEDKP